MDAERADIGGLTVSTGLTRECACMVAQIPSPKQPLEKSVMGAPQDRWPGGQSLGQESGGLGS